MTQNIQVQSAEVTLTILGAASPTIATVAVADTAFGITISTGAPVNVGDTIIVTGTQPAGRIVGYTNGTNNFYRVKQVTGQLVGGNESDVQAWPLSVTAQLENVDGTAVVTTTGATTGLTFKVNGSPQNINYARRVRLINTATATNKITVTTAAGSIKGSFTMSAALVAGNNQSIAYVVKEYDDKIYAAGACLGTKIALGE